MPQTAEYTPLGSLDRVGERWRPAARRTSRLASVRSVFGWARAAHYVSAIADDGDVLLRSEVGAPSRYFIRRRRGERLELTEAVDGDDEHPLLFVAGLDVLERHLIWFTDDICNEVDLGFLRHGAEPKDLARGFGLTDMCAGIAPFGGRMAVRWRQRRTRFRACLRWCLCPICGMDGPRLDALIPQSRRGASARGWPGPT